MAAFKNLTYVNIILNNIFQADYESPALEREKYGTLEKQSHAMVPKGYADDVKALCAYMGVEALRTGMSIRMSLREILGIVPRKRERLDSYASFQNYLKDELGVELVLSSQKTMRNETEKEKE